MIITPEVIEAIEEAIGPLPGGELWVGHFAWPGLQAYQGYNVLLQGEGASYTDELPIGHLAGRDVPASSNGYVVLSCYPGAHAVIGPDGRLAGLFPAPDHHPKYIPE